MKAIDAKDLEKAQAAFTAAVPVIDRMADKGIIHKNCLLYTSRCV